MEHAQEFVDAAEEGEIEDVISFCKMGVNVNVQVGYVSALPCCQTRDTGPVRHTGLICFCVEYNLWKLKKQKSKKCTTIQPIFNKGSLCINCFAHSLID